MRHVRSPPLTLVSLTESFFRQPWEERRIRGVSPLGKVLRVEDLAAPIERLAAAMQPRQTDTGSRWASMPLAKAQWVWTLWEGLSQWRGPDGLRFHALGASFANCTQQTLVLRSHNRPVV